MDELVGTPSTATTDKLFPSGTLASSSFAPSTHPPASDTSTAHLLQHLSSHTRSTTVPTDEETRSRLALLGYNQELSRDWDLWSSVSLTTLNIGTVQGAFWALSTAMVSGGPMMMSTAPLVGGGILLITVAVLAEFASAYPVAGAMFTWVFKLARASGPFRDYARFLSWLCGSFILAGHVFIQVLVCWQSATVFEGILTGAGIDMPQASWLKFLITAGLILVSGAFVCSPVSRSPLLWKALGVTALAMFVITCATLVATSDRHHSLSWVFTHYVNQTGWPDRGYVYLLGWVYTGFLVGAEAAAHMAEETRNPAKTVPRSMFLSLLIGYCLTWVSIICVLVALPANAAQGETPDAIVIGTKGEHIWIVAHSVYAHLPRRFAILVLAGCLFQQICASLAGLFATTRFAWALARDSALPFGDVLRRVSKQKVPTRAAVALTAFSVLLAAPIVATVSHGGMLVVSALFTSSLYFSVLTYMFPIVVYLTCPADVLQLDGRNVWTLRAWSRPLSVVVLLCLCFALAVMACPTASPIQLENWSWSPVVTVGTIVVATLSWIFYGNAHYAGPIRSITVWTTGHEVGLPSASVSSKRGSRKTGSLNGAPAAGGVGGGGRGVKEKTTSLAKGETAAVFEGSLPTDWDEGTGATTSGWDRETGATSTTGWDEETGGGTTTFEGRR